MFTRTICKQRTPNAHAIAVTTLFLFTTALAYAQPSESPLQIIEPIRIEKRIPGVDSDPNMPVSAEESSDSPFFEILDVWARPNGEIAYDTPNGGIVALDIRLCRKNTWCCTPEFEICYFDFGSERPDRLELTLDGAISRACTLLPWDSDRANVIAVGSDIGNNCRGDSPCLMLEEPSSTDSPIDPYEEYKYICFAAN